MNFIFGLLIGAIAASNGSPAPRLPAGFGDIPFRCFAAIEQSDDTYKRCRRLSMTAQMHLQYDEAPGDISGVNDHASLRASVEDALTFEVAALHEMNDAAAARHQTGMDARP